MFTIVDQYGKKVELSGVESQEHLERLVAQNFAYKRFRLLTDPQLFTWGDTTKPAKLLVVPKIGGNLRVTAILPNGEQASFDCQSDEPFQTLKSKMIKCSTEFYQSYQVYENELLLDLKLTLLKQNYQQAPLNVKIVDLSDQQQQIKDQEAIQLLQKEFDMRSDKLKQSEEQQILTQRNHDESVAEKIDLIKQTLNTKEQNIQSLRQTQDHQKEMVNSWDDISQPQEQKQKYLGLEQKYNEEKNYLLQQASKYITYMSSVEAYINQLKQSVLQQQDTLQTTQEVNDREMKLILGRESSMTVTLNGQISTLQNQLEKSKKDLHDDSELHQEQLREKEQKCKKEVSGYLQQVSQYQLQIANLEDSTNQLSQEVLKWEKTLKNTKNEHERQIRQIEAQANECEKLLTQKLNGQIVTLQNNLQKVTTELNTERLAHQEVQRVEEQKHKYAMEAKIFVHNQLVMDHKLQVEASQKRTQDHIQAFNKQKEQNKELKTQVEDLNALVNEKVKLFSDLKQQFDIALSEQITKLTEQSNQNKQLQQDLYDTKVLHQKNIEEKLNQIANSNQIIQKQVLECQQLSQELNQQRVKSQQDKESFKNEIYSANANILQLNNSLQNAETQKSSLSQQNKILTKEANKLKAINQGLEETCADQINHIETSIQKQQEINDSQLINEREALKQLKIKYDDLKQASILD